MKATTKSLFSAGLLTAILAGCGTTPHAIGHARHQRPLNSINSTTTGPVPSTTPASLPPSTQAPPATSIPPGDLPTATIGHWTGIRPSTIYFSGDSGNIATNITWATWNDQFAQGQGLWGHNSCDPDCASGKVTQYAVMLALSRVVSGQFTRLTETQSGPYGRTNTYVLPNPGLGGASQ